MCQEVDGYLNSTQGISFFFGTNLCTSKPKPYLIESLIFISEFIVILLLLISPLIIFIFLPAFTNKLASSVMSEHS